MDGHIDPKAFKACYAQYRQADNDRDILIGQLLDNYDSLHKANTELQEQLVHERETRVMWQSQARSVKKDLAQIKLAAESHPFVVMVIDGDGAKFRDDFFRHGDNGGGFAARELKTQIQLFLQTKYPDIGIDNWNIIVHFYANMDGLAKTLTSRRILSSTFELQRFASGFGRADSLFSFVDVGYGKDKADHKCREMLKVMLRIFSCRHVFFGPCRDNGYLTLLEEFKHDPVIKDKLTLFSAEPAEPGFVDLGFEIANFPTVFRSEPLNGSNGSKHPQLMGLDRLNIGMQPFPPACTPTRPIPPSSTADDLSDTTGGSSFATAISPTSTPSVDNGPVRAQPPSWAVVSKLSNGPVIDLYRSKPSAPKLKYILFNAVNQRIDERLPSVEATASRSIDTKAYAQGRNFCNFYHLTGRCEKGDFCEYQHDVNPKLTASEKLAIRHKCRQLVCSEGQWCDSISCLSGHHCKNIYSGNMCTWGAKCFFKDTHDTDVTPTLKIYEDGTREDLTLQAKPNGR